MCDADYIVLVIVVCSTQNEICFVVMFLFEVDLYYIHPNMLCVLSLVFYIFTLNFNLTMCKTSIASG